MKRYWIGRNEDNSLRMFYNIKPVKMLGIWVTTNFYEDKNFIKLSQELYPNVSSDKLLEITI